MPLKRQKGVISLSDNIDYRESNIDRVDSQHRRQGCPTLVHQRVCVQGTVTITPDITSGPSRSFCIGNPVIGGCPGDLTSSCSFTVGQNICVQIPLTFAATANAISDGLVCGTTGIGPYPEAPCP